MIKVWGAKEIVAVLYAAQDLPDTETGKQAPSLTQVSTTTQYWNLGLWVLASVNSASGV